MRIFKHKSQYIHVEGIALITQWYIFQTSQGWLFHPLTHAGATASVTVQGEMKQGKALILSCIAPLSEDSTMVWCNAGRLHDCCACGTTPSNENSGCSFITLWDTMEGYHVNLNLHECVISVFNGNSSHNGIYSCEAHSSNPASQPIQLGKVVVFIPVLEWWKNPELVKAAAGAVVLVAIMSAVLALCCCCCCRRRHHAGRGELGESPTLHFAIICIENTAALVQSTGNVVF